MPDDLTPLYVRLPREDADLLDRAAFESKTSKRELVTDAVRAHLGLQRGRIELSPAAPPEVLTLAQAAELLQVTEETLAGLAESGELPGRRVGADWRFARAAVLAWLSEPE
jgi:excisionase family DNA binding protein